MTYDVSLTADNKWIIGIDFLAKWSTQVDSRDEITAIATAKDKYRRSTGNGTSCNAANFAESGWKYCMPKENVPKGRSVALCVGAQFYVGSACKRHQLNHIRYTSSKYCPICEYERKLGISS
ncbi:MAG: hypothetical protein ACRCXB_12265 [Aeromonadaceae bacterium]